MLPEKLTSEQQATFDQDVRTTLDGRKSLFDLLEKQGAKNPRDAHSRICEQHPEVAERITSFKFPGAGQRETPVVDQDSWFKIEDKIASLKKNRKKHQTKHLYVIGDKKRKVCKIGISTNVKQRLSSIQTGYPWKLEVWASAPIKDAEIVEKKLHQRFADFRLSGEWFSACIFELIDWQNL